MDRWLIFFITVLFCISNGIWPHLKALIDSLHGNRSVSHQSLEFACFGKIRKFMDYLKIHSPSIDPSLTDCGGAGHVTGICIILHPIRSAAILTQIDAAW